MPRGSDIPVGEKDKQDKKTKPCRHNSLVVSRGKGGGREVIKGKGDQIYIWFWVVNTMQYIDDIL